MWPLLESALNPELPMKDKLTYINLINHVHKLLLKDTEIQILMEKILELIKSPITRCEGYLYMDAFMTNHPTAYIDNSFPMIYGDLECSGNYGSKQVVLRLLRHMVVNFNSLMKAAKKPEKISGQFNHYIPRIVPLLLKTEQNEEVFLYYCQALAICMQYFPVLVGPHSDEIEVFLMKHLDSLSHDVIEALTDCFAALPACMGNFRKPAPPLKDVWFDYYSNVMNTLQALLNELLDFPGVENSLVSVDGLSLLKIEYAPSEGEFSYVFTRIRIFSVLCRILAKMMRNRFESAKEGILVKVPVPDLLQCLRRIYKVNGILRVYEMPKCSAFFIGYPVMQKAVLGVLEALIVNCTIIEQSGNFAKLLKESLEASTLINKETSLNSSTGQTRCATWKTLNTWLKQYGAKGSYEIVNDRFLIQELLKDVTLDSENGHSQANGIADAVREDCCFEALQVLQSIFNFGSSYIEKGLADEISTTILKTIRKIQLYLHPTKKFPWPYTNENCRLKLYDSLLSGSLFGDPLQTKYINQAINIFKIAMKDPNLEINVICHKALKLWRCFLNPKKPPPESLACLETAKVIPPPHEENVQTGWESCNWNICNESSQEEKSMDVTPPCQIDTVYHNSVESDGQRDLSVQSIKSPIHYTEAHENQSQCNGNNGTLVSNKLPSHSNVCNDSESDEVEEYKEYSLEEPHLASVDIPPIASTPIVNSAELQPKITSSESKITELRPLEPVVHENIATTNHHDPKAADGSVESIEELEDDVPHKQPLKRMAENGMDVESEDEESGDEEDEEGTGSDEDEEVNENFIPQGSYSPEYYPPEQEVVSDRCSPDYYHERPVKRRKISNEEDRSSDDYEEEKSSNQNQEMNQDEESEEEDEEVRQSEEEEDEEMPNGSPTVSEMCRDFVLAEPEEIS